MSGILRGAANATSKDCAIIPYRPELGVCLGSMPAAIILVQALYWYTNKGDKPFYKFRSPCDHKLYKEGDSWTEELGISVRVFDYAWKKLESLGLVSKAVTQDRITYHDIDCDAVNAFFASLYDDPKTGNEGAFSKTTKAHLDQTTKAHLPSSQKRIHLNDKRAFRYTETTSETTSDTTHTLSARESQSGKAGGKAGDRVCVDFDDLDLEKSEQRVVELLIKPLEATLYPNKDLPHSSDFWRAMAGALKGFSNVVLEAATLDLLSSRSIFPSVAIAYQSCQAQRKIITNRPSRKTLIRPDTPEWEVWQQYLKDNNFEYRLKRMKSREPGDVDAEILESLMATSKKRESA